MRTWLTIITLIAAFGPAVLLADRLIALGDSLTAGYGLQPNQAWPARLETHLRENGMEVKVANAGVSGDTSAGGLRRLDWILRDPADWLIIALGANDALRGQPIEATRDNLRQIIRQARDKYPEIRIILAGMLAPPNMGNTYSEDFASLFPELAQEEEVLIFPFLLQGVAARPHLNLPDGIHPNVNGHAVIAQNLAEFILKQAG